MVFSKPIWIFFYSKSTPTIGVKFFWLTLLIPENGSPNDKSFFDLHVSDITDDKCDDVWCLLAGMPGIVRDFFDIELFLTFCIFVVGERPYKCHLPECGRAFIQLSNLQQHLRNHDAQVERAKNRPFHCNICGKGFATESSLRTHTSKVSHVRTTLGHNTVPGFFYFFHFFLWWRIFILNWRPQIFWFSKNFFKIFV